MLSGIDVVTGGGGFIGSHLVDALLAGGRRVRVIDNFAVGRLSNLSHHEGNCSLDVVEADVCDETAVMSICRGAERMFHLAARADIVPSITAPTDYLHSNVDGTFVVLEAARINNIQRFIYLASSSCYGVPTVYPTAEDAVIDCRYPYALTKHLGELLVLHWVRVYGLPATVLRLFNVYGPRARTSGSYGAVFGVFLAQLLAHQPLTIVGDGEQTRDFTYVSDVISAILAAGASEASGQVYNVGSGTTVSVNELVRQLGRPPTLRIPKRPAEPDCTWADISKIRRELRWEPRVTFAEGVRIMLDNIGHWADAPVWTVDRISETTATWFHYLGKGQEVTE